MDSIREVAMGARAKRKPVQVVMENGEPSAVIISIEQYRDMLERLEDMDELNDLREMRKKPLKFR
ncbi:MAG: type II toxin-antitoxin system prevent-host-death family antitoxin [SAR202 cluster bacterium]|nr:type II toxin-antitoxin system prevent-host-death family antitoxin [SAR202 cluster bacterium]